MYANNNPISYVYKKFIDGTTVNYAEANFHTQAISKNPNAISTTIPTWIGSVSTGIDHAISLINPIRSAISILKYDNLWELMMLDGVTELPGTLSKVATGVSYGLGVIDGIIGGYEKYSAGASFSSSAMTALVFTKYNIGITAASSASAVAIMGYLSASIAIPGAALVIGGVVLTILIGEIMEWALTECKIFGKTHQEREIDFYDWLIWWD